MSKPRHEPFKAGEEAREMGRRGAAKTNKVRRLKRTMREWAEIFRDTPTKADERMGMGGAVVLKMYDEAMAGDVNDRAGAENVIRAAIDHYVNSFCK